jgi:aspartate carbamoyltransferase catalytic subunit
VANLFFEPSTRTRVSFELAAARLGADVVNLEMQSSSRAKGESVLDTIYTLQAMAVDVFVLRDAEPGLPAWIARPHRASRQRAQCGRGRISRIRHRVCSTH